MPKAMFKLKVGNVKFDIIGRMVSIIFLIQKAIRFLAKKTRIYPIGIGNLFVLMTKIVLRKRHIDFLANQNSHQKEQVLVLLLIL